MPVTVGVVIPVHNRQIEAGLALGSVLAQSRAPDQIVIVDDASLVPFRVGDAQQHHSIQVVRLERNGGPAAARQIGIELLKTSHVAFLDSDDVWTADKLAHQIDRLERIGAPDSTAIATGWSYVDAFDKSGPLIVPVESDRLSDFVSGCWFCPGSTVVMSRAAFFRAGGFDLALRRLEDLDLFIRHAKVGGRLDVVPMKGASIRRGRNGRRAEVDRAAAVLRQKYVCHGTNSLTPQLQRRLDAWLAIEEAIAARNDGHWCWMVQRLFTSLVLVPRLGIQLASWRKPVERLKCD